MNKILTSLIAFSLSFTTQAKSPQKELNPAGIISRAEVFTPNVEKHESINKVQLISAKNGNLIAFSAFNSNKGVISRSSSNNGKTWSKAKPVIDMDDFKDYRFISYVVGMHEQTGHILLIFQLQIGSDSHFYCITSTNRGKSWGQPKHITKQIAKNDWKSKRSLLGGDTFTCTKDGKMIATQIIPTFGTTIITSDDKGKTWNAFLASSDFETTSRLLIRNDGSWLLTERAAPCTDLSHVHISHDQGKTWEKNKDGTVLCPFTEGSYVKYSSVKDGDDKDRLIFCAPYKACDDGQEQGFTVHISYDEGRTWSAGKQLDTSFSGDSAVAKLKNGNIAVAYTKSESKGVDIVIFSLEWLTDGKDKYTAKEKKK